MAPVNRRIGGLEVSVAGLGCNNLGGRIDEARSREVVGAALEAGITVFDTADLYADGRSEEFLGRALGGHRDDVVIISKFGMRRPPGRLSGGDPAWVPQACAQSLQRLGTDHIDLYLLHHPDPTVPVADTLGAMSRLVDQGLVREIGCSNFEGADLEEAASASHGPEQRPLAALENEYSLLNRDPEPEVLPTCERWDLAFIPYYPLASGLLSGKYRRGRSVPAGTRLGGRGGDPTERVVAEDRLAAVERLAAFAEERGHTLLELSMSWLAARRGVATVVAGATSAAQVRANATATTAWDLTEDELTEVDRLTG
ncbi:MAG: aldo/keto reductase [Candidatus Dormibacteria bacterium]